MDFAKNLLDKLPEIVTGIGNGFKEKTLIDDSVKKNASFANEAYIKKDVRKDIGNYKYDKGLSTNDTGVYYNPDKNKIKIVHKGSDSLRDTFDYKDMHDDNLNENKNFNDAKKITEKANKKYNSSKTKHIGHSKGGTFANYLAKQLGHKSVSFNGYNIKNSNSNVHKSYCVVGDPVCTKNFVQNKDEKKINSKKKNKHSLVNFL